MHRDGARPDRNSDHTVVDVSAVQQVQRALTPSVDSDDVDRRGEAGGSWPGPVVTVYQDPFFVLAYVFLLYATMAPPALVECCFLHDPLL